MGELLNKMFNLYHNEIFKEDISFLKYFVNSKQYYDLWELDNKSLDELFNYFGTDKGTKVINPYFHDSNEILGHGFAKFYTNHLQHVYGQKP